MRISPFVLYYGEDVPPSNPLQLRAGPLSLCFDQGMLRYVRLGGREILRRIYFAVRDATWQTIPNRLSNLRCETHPDSFLITFEAESVRGAIDFTWKIRIEGGPGGTLRYAAEGEARSAFQSKRISLCILHPIAECAGRLCSVEHVDGAVEASSFPVDISPHQPFKDMRAIAHEVMPGLSAVVRFEGNTFEMEDQRNWSDASYKTYCPPLDPPPSLDISRGTRISQSVTLMLHGTIPAVTETSAPAVLSVGATPLYPLPAIGLGTASDGVPLSERETGRLQRLNLAHLRVDIHLERIGSRAKYPVSPGVRGIPLVSSQPADYSAVLERATSEAKALGASLEAAIFISDNAEEELKALRETLELLHPPVSTWLVFHINERSTSEKWVKLARTALAPYDPSARFGAGTDVYFVEVNRRRPRVESLDLICCSINPQVHAIDNPNIIENLAGQEYIVQSAHKISVGRPVAVSPVTLKPRFNPNTGTASQASPGELPSNVDARQMSLLGAGWTLGSIKRLSAGGAASITYYETAGPRGVMERVTGSPWQELFRSIPGAVFPMYFIFAWIAEFRGGSVMPVGSSHPLAVEGLALFKEGRKRLLIANLQSSETGVRVEGLWENGSVVRLNEINLVEAVLDPAKFLSLSGSPLPPAPSALTLLPNEIVCIS